MRTRLLVVSLLGLLALPRAAAAAPFVVDSTADASDATAGDGVCATTDGVCTLRAAIEETNALPGSDHIDLPAATYRLTMGQALDVTDGVGIDGADGIATIDALGRGRVLHVAPDATLAMHDVVIRGGTTSGAPGGGGILNEGFVVLGSATLVVNGGDVAAAIHNTAGAFVRLHRSLVSFNGPGPAILNEGEVALDWSTIERNDGLAIENHGLTTLSQTTIDDNYGGIASSAVDAGAPRVLTDRSAVVDNGKLGALVTTAGSAVLRRSTISGNRGAQASAVLASGGSTLEIENATIAANGSADAPTAALDGDGTATVTVRNSIIAGNATSAGDPDCRLTVTSLGTNLMSCSLTTPDPTTIVGDPMLAPLHAWRFPYPDFADTTTYAHAPLPGSPAIDAGSCDPASDQRGTDRPQGTQCDIGAFEAAPLCQGGVAIADARVGVRQSGAWSTIKVRGALSFADPAAPALDPLADGVQLRVERLDGGGGALLERTELTDPLSGIRQGCDGWRVVRPGLRFAWRSSATGAPLCLPGHVGKLAVGLDDQRAKTRGIALKAQATVPRVTPGTAIRVTVVLGGDPLGGSSAGAAGACAVQGTACTSDPNATRFDCR